KSNSSSSKSKRTLELITDCEKLHKGIRQRIRNKITNYIIQAGKLICYNRDDQNSQNFQETYFSSKQAIEIKIKEKFLSNLTTAVSIANCVLTRLFQKNFDVSKG